GAPSRAGGGPRDAWAPVRLLHAGRPSECGGTAPRHAPPRRRDDSPRPRRQPLPVHWLPEHRACRAAGRRVAGPAMTTRAIGARIPRNEDPRLLRGLGCFVDDVNPAGVLHGAVLRSPHAHARIVSIDTARARALSGVELVLTAPDLGEQNQPTPLLIPNPNLTHPRTPRPLARDEVRFVGEPVVFVVARDRYVAEDAVPAIAVTWAPLPIKNGLARLFGLPEFRVDVIAPDVGGGFGTKIMLFYPEEILVPFAAVRLGRPVKWTEDRREHLIAATQERGQRHDVEVAVDADGRILALRDRFLHDAGAYTPYGLVVPIITSTQLPGPYKLRNYAVEFDVVYTNTAMVTPYRGAGRPHGAFVMERVIGLIARELSLEPAEVRRRNFIQPHEFPWDVGLTFQDGGPTRYDSGNYPLGLELALARLGPGDFRRRQAEARREERS